MTPIVLLLVLVSLLAVAVGYLHSRRTSALARPSRAWMRHTVRYRLRRVRLPHDWWEQFERDFAAYVDPRSARARNREQT